jgi:hypothetical protein
VSFTAITLCVASERAFIVVSIYFVIDSLRKLLDTPSYLYVLYLYDIFHVLLFQLRAYGSMEIICVLVYLFCFTQIDHFEFKLKNTDVPGMLEHCFCTQNFL